MLNELLLESNILFRETLNLTNQIKTLVNTENLPNSIELWAHSHLQSLIDNIELINRVVSNSHISRSSSQIHSHHIKHGWLSSSIWSKQAKYFSFLDTECVIVNCSNTILIDLFKLIWLNIILLIIITPYLFRKLFVLKYILMLLKLCPLDCLWLTVHTLKATLLFHIN